MHRNHSRPKDALGRQVINLDDTLSSYRVDKKIRVNAPHTKKGFYYRTLKQSKTNNQQERDVFDPSNPVWGDDEDLTWEPMSKEETRKWIRHQQWTGLTHKYGPAAVAGLVGAGIAAQGTAAYLRNRGQREI